MNLAPIKDIKARLTAMYSGYRFDIKGVDSTLSYSITVFKGSSELSTMSVLAHTPMTDFWEQVHAWMRPIIRYSGM